jgi:hypothetical protein
MRFKNAGGSYSPNYTYDIERLAWYFSYYGGSAVDGSKEVECELIDYAGNVSVSKSDSITLDTVAPVVSSFSINSGATTTSSSLVTLNSAYTGADVMRMSNDGGSTWSVWYNSTTSWASRSLNTDNGYDGHGAKKILVQFSDWAGFYTRNSVTDLASHDTDVSDSIFYGTPVISNSYKGILNTGYIRTYYESYPSDTGSANTFEVYYATTPTGVKYPKGDTINSSNFSATYSTGTPYYIFIKVSNPDIGETDYSSHSFGYSSDMAIIYDDDDTFDTSLASTIKSRITSNYANTYSTISMQGSYTYTLYSVTLVPEDEVPNTYLDEGFNETIVYGDPIITTPSSSTISYVNKAHNIAMGGKSVLAMYYYGNQFIKKVNDNWVDWGLSALSIDGTVYDSRQPDDLYNVTYKGGPTNLAKIVPYNYYNDYIWHRYMYNNTLYANYSGSSTYNVPSFHSTNRDYTYGLTYRYSIYNTAPTNTNGLRYYAGDPDYANYYTIARQGRYVYWAYDRAPGAYTYVYPLLYNIVRYLRDYTDFM